MGATGSEEISTVELLTDLVSDNVSFSTEGITEFDKTKIFSTKDSVLPTLKTELKTVDRNVTEISIKDKISEFSTKEKNKIEYITTISAITTELKTLEEKDSKASVEDKMSTEITFTDLSSDDTPFSNEIIMDVNKLFTIESIDLNKS